MPAASPAAPSRRRFSDLHPLPKIGLWAGTVAAIAAAVQLLCWLIGIEFNVASHGGRGVLLAIALGSLLVMMAADRREVHDYGLFVGESWKKLFFGGAAVGIVTYAAYCAAAVACGALVVNTQSLSTYRVSSAALSGMTSVPVSLVQQIIFTGYLLSLLRDRYSRVTAVVVPAVLFAVLYHLGNPSAIFAPDNLPLLTGMFLIATLLGVLRLQTGSILVPAGLLAGWIFVRRVVGKTLLLVPAGDAPIVDWMAPSGDPRQAPTMWLFLCLGIAICAWIIRRRGEGRVPTIEPAMDTSFKRVFPLSNSSMLSPVDLWLGRLLEARFRIGLKYLPRLAAIMLFSSANTLITLPERLVLPWVLRRRSVSDPVFILGVHRSGTTHLHNLLALDAQYATPRAYQIMNPVGFVFSGWLIAPLMGAFMPWKRPMDSVRFHIFTPQEEEFAISGTCRMSPYWGLSFPRRGAHYDRFILPEGFSPRELASWQRQYMLFLRKLVFWSHRRPLLKNPYNTGRIDALVAMFPRAKFIHIHRHPYAVYKSNMHMAREGHCVQQLQDPDPRDSYDTRFLANYRAMEDAFYRCAKCLPADQVSELAFEELERDPIGQIERIYAELGLAFDEQFRGRLERYLDGIADYQKNRLAQLPEEVRLQIDTAMGPLLDRWGYRVSEGSDSAPAEAA